MRYAAHKKVIDTHITTYIPTYIHTDGRDHPTSALPLAQVIIIILIIMIIMIMMIVIITITMIIVIITKTTIIMIIIILLYIIHRGLYIYMLCVHAKDAGERERRLSCDEVG